MEEENEPQGEGVWLENVVDSTLEHKSRGNQMAAAVTDWALFCWRSKSKTPGPFRFGYIYLSVRSLLLQDLFLGRPC